MTQAEPRRRRSPKGEDRRKQILDAAMRLFARGGYNTVALADVAAEVGITQAGLLHHFPSKADLLMAMLEAREEIYRRNQNRRIAEGRPFFDAYLKALRENEANPDTVQLMAMLSSESLAKDHPAHDWFASRTARLVKVEAEQIGKSIDADKLPEGIGLEDLSRGFIAMADGLRLQWLMDPEAVNRTEIIAKFVEMLLPYRRDDADAETPAALSKKVN